MWVSFHLTSQNMLCSFAVTKFNKLVVDAATSPGASTSSSSCKSLRLINKVSFQCYMWHGKSNACLRIDSNLFGCIFQQLGVWFTYLSVVTADSHLVIEYKGLCVFSATHYVKSVHMRCFFGLYFPVFGLNTEIYRVNPRIMSEFRKIRTRKTPNTDNFHAMTITASCTSQQSSI